MIFEVSLRKYFTPTAIAHMLETMPPLESPILDRVYPEAKRRQHQLPVLGVDEISKVIKNVPVIRRGTAAVPVGGGERAITYIEPQPIEVSSFVSAKELNDLKLLNTESSVQDYIRMKLDYLRQVIRKTTEALAAASLKGEISYPMRTATGYDTYSVSFGETLEYTVTKQWDDNTKTLAEVFEDLLEISKMIKQSSGYGNIKFFAGADAFLALVSILVKAGKDIPIRAEINERAVTLAGFSVEYIDAVYDDPVTGGTFGPVDSDKIVGIAMDAPFTLWYCAIDDIEAGLVAMPFYAVPDTKRNPSGVEIIAKSKPLPVPVPKAICWATVL